jgi:hypothetical protein
MTIQEWQAIIAIIIGIAGVAGILFAILRFYIKAFAKEQFEEIRHELKPNGGSSIKDQVTRLETDVIHLKEQNERGEQFHEKLDLKIDRLTEMFIGYISNSKNSDKK